MKAAVAARGRRPPNSEESQRQLLCVGSVDLAFADSHSRYGSDLSLTLGAVLAGPGGWTELLEAVRLREGDDPGHVGFVVKVHAIDPTSGKTIGFREWTDLSHGQVSRIHEYLEEVAVKIDGRDGQAHD